MLCAALLFLFSAACSSEDRVGPELEGDRGIPIYENSRIYELVSVDPSGHRATVVSDDLEGPLEVRLFPGDAAIYESGRVVRAVPGGTDAEPRIDRLWPVDVVTTPRFRQATRDLLQSTTGLGPNVILTEGDAVPDFGLVDHRGEALIRKDFQGRQIVLNFVFTRCGDINMCPAANARMRELARTVLSDPAIINPVFLVVSFDPENDNPGVLHQFAADMEIDYPDFYYASAGPEIIDRLLRLFGITRNAVNGTYEHTMVTVLIDGGGRIQYRRDGSFWTLDEFLTRFTRES